MAQCSHSECTATCGDDKWSRIRAHDQGWFFRMDGTEQWCPIHLPKWALKWRQRRGSK